MGAGHGGGSDVRVGPGWSARVRNRPTLTGPHGGRVFTTRICAFLTTRSFRRVLLTYSFSPTRLPQSLPLREMQGCFVCRRRVCLQPPGAAISGRGQKVAKKLLVLLPVGSILSSTKKSKFFRKRRVRQEENDKTAENSRFSPFSRKGYQKVEFWTVRQ